MDLAGVLWIGGGPGSGRAEVSRALAQRFALPLYAVDDHEAAHAPRMPTLAGGGTIEALLTAARHRFRLVLEDVAALPPSPAVIVEGPQLFPTSVAAVLREPSHALFLLPAGEDAVSRRIGWEARDLRLALLRADVPLEELAERAAAHFLPLLA